MLRRKAVFVVLDQPNVDANVLDLVRDFSGMGYQPIPVLARHAAFDAPDEIRLRTGAPLGKTMVATGAFGPAQVWSHARSLFLDLERSIVVSAGTHHDEAFVTAGVRRVIPRRTAAEAA